MYSGHARGSWREMTKINFLFKFCHNVKFHVTQKHGHVFNVKGESNEILIGVLNN